MGKILTIERMKKLITTGQIFVDDLYRDKNVQSTSKKFLLEVALLIKSKADQEAGRIVSNRGFSQYTEKHKPFS